MAEPTLSQYRARMAEVERRIRPRVRAVRLAAYLAMGVAVLTAGRVPATVTYGLGALFFAGIVSTMIMRVRALSRDVAERPPE